MSIRIQKLTINKILLAVLYFVAVIVSYFIVPNEYKTTFQFYMTILSVALLFVTVSDLINNKGIGRILFWIGIFVLGSVMAFRAQTGIDDLVYKRIFSSAAGLNPIAYLSTSGVEAGYLFLNWFLFRLTNGNYDVAQAIITFFSFFMWGLAIQKYKKNSSIAILALFLWTYYYFLIMGAALVRIFLALSIVFYALTFMWERNWKKYIFWILFASVFHMSALIMLIFLLITINEQWVYKHWITLILVLLVLIPVAFILIARYIVPLLGTRYAQYGAIGDFSLSIGSFDTLPVWIIGVYYYQFISPECKNQYTIGILLISLSMIFSIFASMVSIGRVIYFANLGILIVAGQICKLKPRKAIDYFVPGLLVAYAMFYMVYTGVFNDTVAPYLFPYTSFWG